MFRRLRDEHEPQYALIFLLAVAVLVVLWALIMWLGASAVGLALLAFGMVGFFISALLRRRQERQRPRQ